MIISDEARAVRKLSQIGYYRLSGFWYPCRRPKRDENGRYLKDEKTNLPIRDSLFQEDVSFEEILGLYLFDKRLRQLILDAVERIEIYMRTLIAHEVGRIDPLAYEREEFINPKVLKTKRKGGVVVNHWYNWTTRLNELINTSKEDSIKWHRDRNRPIPFWALIECWDFGLMSKYFENLNGRCQNQICKQIGIQYPGTLKNWLIEINVLRNRCAHHSRIWNREEANPISLKGLEKDEYFNQLSLTDDARKRIFGRICVMWYLVKKIGPSSNWITRVANIIDQKPKIPCCPLTAMGLPHNDRFPRQLFGIEY